MKLVKKLLGKVTGKKKKEKQAKKAKHKLHVLGLCASFCAGVAVTSVIVYRHREKLAVLTVGKRNIRPRFFKKK